MCESGSGGGDGDYIGVIGDGGLDFVVEVERGKNREKEDGESKVKDGERKVKDGERKGMSIEVFLR